VILDVEGLHKSFGDLEVLKGIDLRVAERELVFVIGPSGSGKSTLLRCCNRLEEPSSGSIRVAGIDIMAPGVDINALRRRIGMVFQSFNLYPHLNALGNALVPLITVIALAYAGAALGAVLCKTALHLHRNMATFADASVAGKIE
jgi:polar amino acid transport system ATP-binding protein